MTRSKLTDKQKKKIIADYVENQNYAKTGRINGVDTETVRRVVKADQEFATKSEKKKEENTQDILRYMDSIAEKQKKIIDLSLDVIEEMLTKRDKRLNVKDIATVYGVIFDKALKYKELQIKRNIDNSDNLNNAIVNIATLLNSPKKVRTEEDIKEAGD